MKNVLTRLFMFMVICSFELSASSYVWSAKVNKSKAYVNEAIYLEYECRFSDRAELYAVEFDPIKSDENARIVMLSERSRVENGKKILSYEFVAFVHNPQEYIFDFTALMKKTTQDSIENTVIGRDNGKYAEYQTTPYQLKSLKVEVLPTGSKLVGSLKLAVKKDKAEVKALQPYHMEIKIEGIGDFESLKPLAFEIEGVKVFSEKPMMSQELTQNGYRGVWSQKFAFVAEKSFSIEDFSMNYFDLNTQSIQKLHFAGFDVNVTEGIKPQTLLDAPKEPKFKLSWEYLYYFLTFIAGFLIAKIEFKDPFKAEQSDFCNKVHECTSLDSLMILLIMQNQKKYVDVIEKIEANEYRDIKKIKNYVCGLVTTKKNIFYESQDSI